MDLHYSTMILLSLLCITYGQLKLDAMRKDTDLWVSEIAFIDDCAILWAPHWSPRKSEGLPQFSC